MSAPRYVPCKEYPDAFFVWPRCGHRMILIQVCGSTTGGPRVGHWYDAECDVIQTDFMGSYRCVHMKPDTHWNEPPLQPVGDDVLPHAA